MSTHDPNVYTCTTKHGLLQVWTADGHTFHVDDMCSIDFAFLLAEARSA